MNEKSKDELIAELEAENDRLRKALSEVGIPKWEVISLADLAGESDGEYMLEHEIAYRRGYVQGYYTGSEDEREHGPRKVDNHWNNVLVRWRYKRPLRFDFPPEISARKVRKG